MKMLPVYIKKYIFCKITIVLIAIIFLQMPSVLANIEFESSTQGSLTPPPDMVVSCKYWFNLRDLDDPSNPTFGKIVGTRAARRKLSTYDIVCPGFCESDGITGYNPDLVQDGKACDYFNDKYVASHPDQKYHLVWGWDGFTNSPEPVQIDVRDLRACGSGKIVRNFQIREGGRWVSVGSQTIWIVNCDRFYINRDICRDNRDDIEWPLNCNQPNQLDGCGADTKPSNPRLGRPKIVNGGRDNCSMIAIDFKDEYITVVPNACFKILRTWRVVDWCQYHPTKNPFKGKWEYLQVIKVKDNLDPIISFDSIGRSPLDTVFSNGVCGGHFTLSITATDDCTPLEDLRYEYKIDLDNDGQGKYGSYDLFYGSLTKVGIQATQHDNIYADDTTTVLNASGYYPVGTHKISWFVEDGCGNVVVRDTIFTIKDEKAPTPYCQTGIITVVMPSNGSITIWASDLDAGSFDNCSAQKDLKLYFNGDTSWTGYVVNCDTIENRDQGNKVLIEVELWVEDEEGNTDYCLTIIEVQDNNNTCPNLTTNLYGQVWYNGVNHLDSVEVQLVLNDTVLRSAKLDSRGNYVIDTSNIPLDASLILDVKGNEVDWIHGLSTRDLVKIQKHLLGYKKLDQIVQYLSGDIDGSQSITIKDLLIMYKLLLDKIDLKEARKLGYIVDLQFYVNKCPLLTTPDLNTLNWPKLTDKTCSKLSWIQQYYNNEPINFHYYHMGDVSTRTNPEMIEWTISELRKDIHGSYISIEWSNTDKIEWSAFDLSFNTTLEGHFVCDNRNVLFDKNDQMPNHVQMIGINKDDINNTSLELKYYLKDENTSLDVMDIIQLTTSDQRLQTMLNRVGDEFIVSLKSDKLVKTNEMELLVTPNPFYQSIQLSIISRTENMSTIRLYSLTGNVLRKSNIMLRSGTNSIYFEELDALSKGVYYISIENLAETLVQKIIKH